MCKTRREQGGWQVTKEGFGSWKAWIALLRRSGEVKDRILLVRQSCRRTSRIFMMDCLDWSCRLLKYFAAFRLPSDLVHSIYVL